MSTARRSPVSAPTLNGDEPNSSEPLYHVKLLSALRNGDPALIHPFLAEIGKDRRKSRDGEDFDTGAAALHLAVRCASVQTTSLLLSHRAISPNGVHPPKSGTTPLHLAASLGRAEIVNLLLEQEGIDDTLKDNHGRTCRDVARGKEVVHAIDDSRSFLNASFRSLLRSYILSPSSAAPNSSLISLLESPRSKLVNLSYLDDDSGKSLLHEAARRKDLRLIELAVRAGADVFVRDRRGRMAYESAGKDDRVRVFLRQFANHDTTLIQAPQSEPPTLKGYLNKYTNVAKGYNTRWLVLKDGVLSYYRHQEDETVASRGAISMKTAVLKISPGVERLRFEVHSTPSRGHHSGVQKWYLKANHPVEAARWTQAISMSIDWHKGSTDGERRSGESGESGESGRRIALMGHTLTLSGHAHKSSLSGSVFRRRPKAVSDASSAPSTLTVADAEPDDAVPESLKGGEPRDTEGGDPDGEDNDESSTSGSSQKTPPHEAGFELHGNSTAAQMELTGHLLSNLTLPPGTPTRTQEVRDALADSFGMAQGLLNEYVQMVNEREQWWRRQLNRERARQTMWEESLATVVKEGEVLERELRTRSRNRGSKFFDAGAPGIDRLGTIKQRRSVLYTNNTISVPEEDNKGDTILTNYFPVSEPPLADPSTTLPLPTPTQATSQTLAQQASMITIQSPGIPDTESTLDTDEEDEFFDAIEADALPNLVVHDALMSPLHNELIAPKYINVLPYAGYRNLRTRLSISSDDRPSTSLWSVLKHSIGKDLTKISFPVFFNEPTSMLQRMAEDMEFSECLDVAAHERDPLRRLAFVAAFAMSNYSSTIGRIAKPFNPMLGETFEYVRLDKEFRYVSEQVSHHPPISACWADSPYWRYYGEVDAQNKFMGKSFEIRPTGVAHADLLLPAEVAPSYPIGPTKFGEEKVVEHYSWKKVTTNVSGFILGSPTIDHYGDMIITNHRTNDQCILTFKPRGWRGRDAFEISGRVMDSTGKPVYEIAGRWNSKLIARLVGTGSGFLHPDIALSPPNSPSALPQEHILLWKNSQKPAAPFNLTPFAITLNDCPEDTLRPFLCPTDCRLRPDQRAFELGKYERANELKNAQEEHQRTTRKAREEGRLPPHRPRWFTASTDGDTGERVWLPHLVEKEQVEYWAERERVWREGGNVPWNGVDPIFVDPDEEQ